MLSGSISPTFATSRQPVGFQLRDRSVVRGAQADRVHRHALEDSLQIEHRPAHVPQDLGDRRLAVEGVCCALEQASVLDGDDGLIRECAHERDLPIGEWAYLVPSQHEHAGDRIATKEGYAEHRSIAAEDLEVPRRVFAVGEDVGNVDDRPLQRRTSDERLAPWRARRFVGHTLVFGVARSPERRRAIHLAVEDVDRGTLGAAQAGGAIEDGIEYDGELAWSTPHEAEDFRERGLAGTRLRELLFEVGRSAQGWSPLPGQC